MLAVVLAGPVPSLEHLGQSTLGWWSLLLLLKGKRNFPFWVGGILPIRLLVMVVGYLCLPEEITQGGRPSCDWPVLGRATP